MKHLLAALTLALVAAAAFGAPAADLDREITRVLRAVGEGGTLPADQAVDRLAALGHNAAGRLLAAGRTHRGLGHVEAIAETLARLNDPRLDDYLLDLAESDADLSVRAKALVKLKEHGTASALPRIVKEMPRNNPRLKLAVAKALTGILVRNPGPETYVTARDLFDRAPNDTRARLLSAIADAGSEHGLLMLGDLLGYYPDLELVIVSGLGRMHAIIDDRGVVAKLRPYLESPEKNLRRECALALGRFRDGEAVEMLIQLLYDGDRGVQANAAWSLRRISGMNLPADPALWKSWYEGQKSWWNIEGRHWLHRLDSDDPDEVLAAIYALSEKPAFRGRFGDRLESLLDHSDSRIKKAAAEALARLRNGPEHGVDGKGGGAGGYGALAAGATILGKGAPSASVPAEDEEGGSAPWKTVMFAVWGGIVLCLLLRVGGVVSMDRVRSMLPFGAAPEPERRLDPFRVDQQPVFEINTPGRKAAGCPKVASAPEAAPETPEAPEAPPPPEEKTSPEPDVRKGPAKRPPGFGGWMDG